MVLQQEEEVLGAKKSIHAGNPTGSKTLRENGKQKWTVDIQRQLF